MLDTDFSPAVAPTVEQQRDALQKGLGRAVTWTGRDMGEGWTPGQ